MHPGIYQSTDGRVYVDCPGFFDTRGDEERVWGKVSMQLVTKLASRIKGVIVVVEESNLTGIKGEGIIKISEEIGRLFTNPSKVIDSLLLVVTKGETQRYPITEKSVVNRISSKITAIKEKQEEIKNKYRRYDPHVDHNGVPHAYKYDIPFPDDQDPIKRKDGKEWARLSRELSVLLLFEKVSLKERLVLTNVLDKSEKGKITIKLDQLKPLSQEDLALDEYSAENLKFNRILDVVVSDGARLFSQQEDLTAKIINLKTEIDFLEKNINNLKSNLDVATAASNEQLAQHYQNQIEKIKNKISIIEQRKIKLEAEGEKISLYYKEPFYEERSLLGFFSWSLHKFSYKDIPFDHIIKARKDGTLFDSKRKGYCYFENEVEDKVLGLYEGTYKSGFYANGDAILEVYVAEKEKKPFQEEQRQLTDELTRLKTEKSLLEESHAKIFSKQSKAEAILDHEQKKQVKINELVASRRDLDEVTNSIRTRLLSFVAINDILGFMRYDQNLTIRFSQWLSKPTTYIQHADELMLVANYKKALETYTVALKYDPNNALALEGCAKSLVALKLPEKAMPYYDKALSHLDPDSKTQKSEIESEKKAIQLLVEFRPKLGCTILNPAVYAYMSELAYKDDLNGIQRDVSATQLYDSLPPGWEILTTSQQGVVGVSYNHDDYFAMVFRHEQSKQIVIAHRGTKKAGALRADGELVRGDFPKQFTKAAAPFTEKVVTHNPGYEISHTGHSLGGSLAALCAYLFCSSAVIFEPFGIKHTLERHSSLKNLGDVNFDALPVTTYLSAPNLVNTAAGHVGLIFQVCPNTQLKSLIEITYDLSMSLWRLLSVPVPSLSTVEEITGDIMRYHSMSKVRSLFDIDTGLHSMTRLVKSWPSNSNNYVRLISVLPSGARDFIDPGSLNQGNRGYLINKLGFDVINYDRYRIKLTHFDHDFRKLITDICQDRKPLPVHPDIALILSRCDVENDELVIADGSITAIELKLYLEKTLHLQSYRNCPLKQIKIEKDPPALSPDSPSFFKQHGSVITKTAAAVVVGSVIFRR